MTIIFFRKLTQSFLRPTSMTYTLHLITHPFHPIIMAALCNRGGPLYFCPVVSFFFLSSFFLSSPNLSGRRLDVSHTSTHGVALVRIYNAGLKCAARGSLQMQDPKSRQNSTSGHHPTTLSSYIFATKACIDNRKKIY